MKLVEGIEKNKNELIPLNPEVRRGTLPNGFSYYILRNTTTEKRALFYLVNKVGSVLEDDDQRGLAHFIEHMNFNGTKHFPKNELVNYLQKAGIRFGADLNAYTSFDETVYQLPLPTDNPELLANGVQIMRDWAQDASFDQTELDKERGIVLEEKRLRSGAGQRLSEKYLPVLLNGSIYSLRFPIGVDTVIKNFTRETILRYYHDWYRPDLQALIIIGDVNVDEIEKMIVARFSDLANPSSKKPRPTYTVALNGKNQFIALADKEASTEEIDLYIKTPATSIKTAGDLKNQVIRNLFDQMIQARCSNAAIKGNPPYLKATASINNLFASVDGFTLLVICKQGAMEEGLKAAWEQVEKIKRYGFTSSELERNKQAILARVDLSLKQKDKTPATFIINEYKENFLHNQAAPGPELLAALKKKCLQEITLNDVNSLAKQYIKSTDRDIIVTAPESKKDSLPDEATVNKWLNEVENQKLNPYVDEALKEPLLSKQPSPGKIIGEEYIKSVGVTLITLSNGVKVYLKPTSFDNSVLSFTASAPGGTSVYNDSDFVSARMSREIILSGGAGNFDHFQLQKALAGSVIRVSGGFSDYSMLFAYATIPKDLETALQLNYLNFTAPRKDTPMFNTIMNRIKTSLAIKDNNPQHAFNDTLRAVLNNYNFRANQIDEHTYQQLNLDKCYRIYKESVADASNYTFNFIGNFEIDSIKPLLEKYVGSLPSTFQHTEARNVGLQPAPGKVSKIVYQGSTPKANAALVFHGKYEYNPSNNLNMTAMASVIQIRLLERLREEESGVYSPSANVQFVKAPEEHFTFSISFTCDPNNVDKLIASALDEVNKLKNNGPDTINVQKFTAERSRNNETSIKSNAFWVGYLTSTNINKDDLEQVTHNNTLLNSVTSKSIQTTANKFLSDDNFIKVILLPENQTSKTRP